MTSSIAKSLGETPEQIFGRNSPAVMNSSLGEWKSSGLVIKNADGVTTQAFTS